MAVLFASTISFAATFFTYEEYQNEHENKLHSAT